MQGMTGQELCVCPIFLATDGRLRTSIWIRNLLFSFIRLHLFTIICAIKHHIPESLTNLKKQFSKCGFLQFLWPFFDCFYSFIFKNKNRSHFNTYDCEIWTEWIFLDLKCEREKMPFKKSAPVLDENNTIAPFFVFLCFLTLIWI